MNGTIPLLAGGRRATHSSVREAAVWALERTLDSIAPAETYLAAARGRCDERDHALLHELVLGTLRWLRRLDHVIATAADRPLDKIEPALLSTLRMGVYQLLFLDRVPSHAVVNEAVAQARHKSHRGGGNFVNAVLRRVARSRLDDFPVSGGDPVARMSIELSHPEFLVRRWVGRFGETATRRLLEANNRAKPLHLLAFRDRGGRELVAEELIDEGLEVEPSDVSPLGLKVLSGRPWSTTAFQRGDLYIQDEVSQIAALIPWPSPGDRVLDVAAAPGGKTFALLAFEPSLQCVASDVSLSRIARMRANLGRLGRELPLVVADGALPGLSGDFDRVVVDLPCSGTGTLRRKPELKWRVSEAEIERLSSLGLAVLAGAAGQVRSGGLLVAITCSLEPEENEFVVDRFVTSHRDFSRVDLGSGLAPALAAWVVGPGLWRQPTADDHDGFTVQVLERRAS